MLCGSPNAARPLRCRLPPSCQPPPPMPTRGLPCMGSALRGELRGGVRRYATTAASPPPTGSFSLPEGDAAHGALGGARAARGRGSSARRLSRSRRPARGACLPSG
eukprot:353529-Chlamydomonas_euryale.AAC.18